MEAMRVCLTVEDSAACRQDVEIFCPLQAHLEFAGAISGPNQVGMRVDESGQDYAAAGVEGGFVAVSSAQLIGGADCDDLFVAHDDRAVLDDPEFSKVAAALGAACEGKELGCRVDEHDFSRMP